MTFGISVIGTGYMALKHLNSLASLNGISLEQIWSTKRSADKAKQFASQFKFQSTTHDIKSILSDDKTNIVLICSPDGEHADHVESVLQAGKHVLCEKPLARTEKDFIQIKTALEKSKKKLQVGMNCRFRDQYALAKQAIVSNSLGPLNFIRGTYVVNMVDAMKKGVKPWMQSYPKDIYPFVHGGGIHCLDLIRWIGGDIKTVFARTNGGILCKELKSDTVSVSLEFKSGAIGELLVAAAAFRPNDFSLELWCENGSVVGTKIYKRKGNATSSEPCDMVVIQEKMDLVLEWEDFFSAIKNNKLPLNSFDEAYKNFKVLKAIDKSIQEKMSQTP